ncbi:MAG: hypothetical protein LBR89_01385 [Holosporales bacterium]|jgi:NADH:ubiquinone oxidoreductase subunit D|nr:hypothetical protein [Holosporales bacterium]
MTPQTFIRNRVSKKNTQTFDLFNGRISLAVNDEQIVALFVDVDKCVRAVDKRLEQQHLLENIRTIGRLEPHSCLAHELAFVQGVERLLDMDIPPEVYVGRVILCEGERIMNHILTLGKVASSVGIYPLHMQTQHIQRRYEALCEKLWRRRIPVDLFIPGGTMVCMTRDAIEGVVQFFDEVASIRKTINWALLRSRLFKNRAMKVACLRAETVSCFNLSGVTARASGVGYDVRCFGEAGGSGAEFSPILGEGGDVWARVNVRVEEIGQSLDIMHENLSRFTNTQDLHKPSCIDVRNQRIFFVADDLDETQINEGTYPIKERYSAIESANGEFGVSLVGGGESRLQRCKVNSPTFCALQALESVAIGENIMDLDLIIASMGISTVF